MLRASPCALPANALPMNRRRLLQLGGGLALAAGAGLKAWPTFAQGQNTLTMAIPADTGGWDYDYLAFDLIGLALLKNTYPHVLDYGVKDVAGGQIHDTETVLPVFAEILGAERGPDRLDPHPQVRPQVPVRQPVHRQGRKMVEGPRLRRPGECRRPLPDHRPDHAGAGRTGRRPDGAVPPAVAERDDLADPHHLPLRLRQRAGEDPRHRRRPVGQGLGQPQSAARRRLQCQRLPAGPGNRHGLQPGVPGRPAGDPAGPLPDHPGAGQPPPAARMATSTSPTACRGATSPTSARTRRSP